MKKLAKIKREPLDMELANRTFASYFRTCLVKYFGSISHKFYYKPFKKVLDLIKKHIKSQNKLQSLKKLSDNIKNRCLLFILLSAKSARSGGEKEK